MAVGVDLDEFQIVGLRPRQRVELDDRFDLVAEEIDAPRAVLIVRREQVDRVAAHAEHAAHEIAERALVLQRHQIGDHLPLIDLVADRQRERHRRIGLDRADAVDARDGGDDDDVVALQHRARRGVAHAVDLFVDRGFLLDIGVGARHVGLGLIIIVVGDEILDGVVGEEALELPVKLRRERLVGRQDQRRPLRRLDHLGHRERLARAGDAQQHLIALLRLHPLDQLPDRLRLVALGLELRHDLERPSAFRLRRPLGPVRRPGRAIAQVGVAALQQLLERFDGGARARHAARVLRLEIRRRLRETFVQRGVQQRRQMLAEGMHLGLLRLGFGSLRHTR